MQKEVLVSVSGVHNNEEPKEAVEVLLPGEYYCKNGTHYIMYEQYEEESGALIKNTIKVKGLSVELKKTGRTNVRMYFEKHHNTTSYYDMEQGSMLLETKTSNVQVIEEADKLQVYLNYALYINEQYISDCMVTIKVVERSGKK